MLLAGGRVWGFITNGAGLLGAGDGGLAPAGLFSGEPTGISHLCPGAPCAGLRPAVALLLMGLVAAGMVFILPAGPDPGTGAGVVVVVGADCADSSILLSSELLQEANASAIKEMLRSFFMIKGH